MVSTGHTSPAGDHRKNWPDSGLGAAAAWAGANYSVLELEKYLMIIVSASQFHVFILWGQHPFPFIIVS